MGVNLIYELKGHEALDEAEKKLVLESFERMTLKRNDYFLREGQVCRYVGFLQEGLVVYYTLNADGIEQVCDFGTAGNWITQYESFTEKKTSSLFIKATEYSTLYVISIEKLNELYRAVPAFESVSRKIIEKIFMEMVNRTRSFQMLGAEERYAELLKNNPAIANRVPQYYIASFLGIAPQSLSRIRNNYKKGKS